MLVVTNIESSNYESSHNSGYRVFKSQIQNPGKPGGVGPGRGGAGVGWKFSAKARESIDEIP